jgi:hypothetical protein
MNGQIYFLRVALPQAPVHELWSRVVVFIGCKYFSPYCYSRKNLWSVASTSENHSVIVKFHKEMRLVSLEIPEPDATVYQNLTRQNPDLSKARFAIASHPPFFSVAPTAPAKCAAANSFHPDPVSANCVLLLCQPLFTQLHQFDFTTRYNYQNSDQGRGVRANLIAGSHLYRSTPAICHPPDKERSHY